jgi:Iodothyronine deiodinase
MDTYRDRANLLTIYIEEAHALDEWPIGSRIAYAQPKSDADRLSIAQDFIAATGYRLPMLVDPVSRANPFSRLYAPWPIRFYIIDQHDTFSFIAAPVGCSFSLNEISQALDAAIDR